MLKKTLLMNCITLALLASSGTIFAQESKTGLTEQDIAVLEAKKDAILYLLMEKGELEPLLKELRSQELKQSADREIINAFPYTQEQIINRRQKEIEYERVQNTPIKNKDVNISEEDYNPDSNSPILLRVASNNPSSLAFFDYQGNPWPIVGEVIGDPLSFNSNPFSESKNTAIFQIKKRFSETVALINLQGIDQLVVVKLVGDEDTFDARKNIRIPRRGPLSEDTISGGEMAQLSSDPILIQLLNGESINNSIEYGGDWDDDAVFMRVDNLLYVRTKDEITYPPKITGQKSANGYNLYKMDFSNTVIVKKDGQYQILTLTKKRGSK